MAFGADARQISEFSSAGPGPEMMRDSPQAQRIWQRLRLETVAAQIQRLQGFITTLEIKASALAAAQQVPPEQNKSLATFCVVDIFMSHSARDAELTGKLVALIESALKIRSAKIRCTSIPGRGFEGGAHVPTRLREEIKTCRVFLAVLTEASNASAYVMAEIGARWMTERDAKILRGGGFEPASVKGPLTETHSLSLSSETDLHQLITELAAVLKVEAEPPQAYLRSLKDVMQASTAAATAPRLEPPHHSEQLSSEQESILQRFVGREDRRMAAPDVNDITHDLRLEVSVVRYQLNELLEMGLLEWDGIDHIYLLSHKGRAYCVKHRIACD